MNSTFFSIPLSLRVTCALLLACTAGAGVWAAEVPVRNVLVIYTDNRFLPANVEMDRALAETLVDASNRRVQLFSEFLDVAHFSGPAHTETMLRYLRDKYVTQAPYVIIAAGEESLPFLLHHRGALFPGVPIVHVGMQRAALQTLLPLPLDVVGVPVAYDFRGTIEQALRFHPHAYRLLIIAGSGEWDRANEATIRSDVAQLDSSVSVEFLSGLPIDDVLERVRKLDRDTIVFSGGFERDGAGVVFLPRDAIARIADASSAPVYGQFNTFVGTGIVGGRMPSFFAMGRAAGVVVDQLLDGAAPQTLKVADVEPTQLQLDWRQLRRWGIDEKLIPPDAAVQFRQPTFWETYGLLILVATGVIILQAILIAALLYERRRQRRTAAALEASERRMILAGRTARLSNWAWNVAAEPGRANGTARPDAAHMRAPISKEPNVIDFDDVLEATHAADRETLSRAVRHAVANDEELEAEYRVVYPHHVRWFAVRGRMEPGSQQMRGVALDITERKTAELRSAEDQIALRHITRVSLLGQLSASIAHQLNQPLAAILSNAEAAQKMLSRDGVDLDELRAICDDIVTADHRAAAIIRRLSALFKRGTSEFTSIDVNALVLETLELMRTDLAARRVNAMTELAPDLAAVEGERVQLQQVLLNLIVNAADAMNGIETERALIVRTAATVNGIGVSVVDRGPGIDEHDLTNIFQPFWSTKQGGMGIGLAVCRSIISAHGGELSASNNADGGATLRATLPAKIHA